MNTQSHAFLQLGPWSLHRSKSYVDPIWDSREVYGPNEQVHKTYIHMLRKPRVFQKCFQLSCSFAALDLLLWPITAFHFPAPQIIGMCNDFSVLSFASVSTHLTFFFLFFFVFFIFVRCFLSVMDYVKIFFILNVLIKSSRKLFFFFFI